MEDFKRAIPRTIRREDSARANAPSAVRVRMTCSGNIRVMEARYSFPSPSKRTTPSPSPRRRTLQMWRISPGSSMMARSPSIFSRWTLKRRTFILARPAPVYSWPNSDVCPAMYGTHPLGLSERIFSVPFQPTRLEENPFLNTRHIQPLSALEA